MSNTPKAEQLHEAASAAAGGLDDFGEDGDDYRTGLDVLLGSLASDARLNELGEQVVYGAVTGALIGRLVSQAGWIAAPGHATVPIERPIFVTGLARAGTTAMHRMLGADPAHQALEMWLGASPQPRPPISEWSDNPAFMQLDAALRSGLQGTPEGKALHYLSAEQPDECHLLTAQSFRAISFPSLAYVPSYVDWLSGQDWAATMRRHRRNLQLIGLNSPEQRWVLKNPGHLAALDGLMAAYPDALVVHMHRDPKETIPSVASVIQFYQGKTSPMQNGERLARLQLQMYAHDLGSFVECRRAYPRRQFVDVYYRDYLADPMGTVRSVYERFGLPCDETTEASIAHELELSTTGDRAPRHHYALADFGLTSGEVDALFADYYSMYPHVLD